MRAGSRSALGLAVELSLAVALALAAALALGVAVGIGPAPLAAQSAGGPDERPATGGGPEAPAAPEGGLDAPLAIVGGQLIDGNEGPPIHDAVVVVEGNRIAHVGTRADTRIPEGARVIDARGKSVLPGLHDCHVHLMIIGHGTYSEYFPRYQDRLREILPVSARQLLEAGVTSARDVGAPLEDILWIKREIEEGRLPGPRLFVSGPFVQKTTGPTQAFFRRTVDGERDARRQVRELVDAGVDLIKVVEAHRFTPAERAAVAEEARRAGLHISAHAYDHEELEAAVEMGALTIEHVNPRSLPRYPEESVRLMAERGVAACLTAVVDEVYEITEEFPARLDDRRLVDDLPPAIYEDVRASLSHPERLGYFHQKREISPWHGQKVRQLLDAGVRILVGTDSGTPMNFHYEATWQEMDLLVRHGMEPMKVISAATRHPAQLYGLGDQLGTIEPGKLADIIVVDGDPLRDISTLRNVVHVIKDGVQVR